MKKTLFFLLLNVMLFSNFQLQAQWFTNGPGIVYTLDEAGIGEDNPDSKLHIKSAINQDALRVRVDNATKLYVHHLGGVTIGVNHVPPANGLYVHGKTGIGGDPDVEAHIYHGYGGPTHGLRLTNTSGNNVEWSFYSSNDYRRLWLYRNGNRLGEFDDVTGEYSSISDRRLKKDFESAGTLMPKILQIEIQKFNFINSEPDALKHYGVVAQKMVNIIPEVVNHTVSEDGTNDTYSIKYSTFGIIAIKGIQELHQTIQAQQLKIITLEDRISKLEAAINSNSINKANSFNKGNNSRIDLAGASLEQNEPNPFNEVTTFRYRIPAGTKAQILITDISGRKVKSLEAPENGQVEINANELQPGIYIYSLVVDGQTVASKRMVLSR
jgi:hypothetical protein